MKRIFALILAMAVVILCLPAAVAFKLPEKDKKSTAVQGNVSGWETVSVYLEKEKKVLNLKAEDYLTGVLFAEMDPEYETEALKAQAVASYTYYLYTKTMHTKAPDTALMGAYISDSAAKYQGYMQSSAAKEKYGDKYGAYLEKITSAIDAVAGKVITYDSRPILAAFHHSNGGFTEDAQQVWGKDYKYLKSVESKGDSLSPTVSEKVTYNARQLFDMIKKEYDVTQSENPAEWFGRAEKSDAGTVKKITFCGVEFTGAQLRTCLALKSAAFDVALDGDNFVFTVYGYGHGAGMSQYGADYMARQGAKYDEILKHYYTGVSIKGEA